MILNFSKNKKRAVNKRPLPATHLLNYLKYLATELLFSSSPSTILFEIQSPEYLMCPYFLFYTFLYEYWIGFSSYNGLNSRETVICKQIF